MAKTGMIIQGAIGVIIGLVIIAIGMYAVAGLGFSETTWKIMDRVIQSYEWGMYLTIIGMIVLLIGVIVTYFGFRKKPVSRAMVEYVRGSEHDMWHWCRNCTQYPSYIYQRISDRPHSSLCQQCKEKEDNDDCTMERARIE